MNYCRPAIYAYWSGGNDLRRVLNYRHSPLTKHLPHFEETHQHWVLPRFGVPLILISPVGGDCTRIHLQRFIFWLKEGQKIFTAQPFHRLLSLLPARPEHHSYTPHDFENPDKPSNLFVHSLPTLLRRQDFFKARDIVLGPKTSWRNKNERYATVILWCLYMSLGCRYHFWFCFLFLLNHWSWDIVRGCVPVCQCQREDIASMFFPKVGKGDLMCQFFFERYSVDYFVIHPRVTFYFA